MNESQGNGFNHIAHDVKHEEPNNDYVESCSGYDNGIEPKEEPQSEDIKREQSFNVSQASSCDYSMSQFKNDEPPFEVKEEATYEDESMYREEEPDVEDEEDEDEEDIPLAKRKLPAPVEQEE